MEYENKGHKNKKLSDKKYLYMIRPYLSNLINDHKTQGVWKVHLGNKVIDYKTQEEWKMHLTMSIKFMSSKDSEETRTMHTKSHNVEIAMCNKTDILSKNFLNRFYENIKKD